MITLIEIWRNYITPLLDEMRGICWSLLGSPMEETDTDFRRLLRGEMTHEGKGNGNTT